MTGKTLGICALLIAVTWNGSLGQLPDRKTASRGITTCSDWYKLSHKRVYPTSILPKKFLPQRGPASVDGFLLCPKTGVLIRAYLSESAFEVILFPDPTTADCKFAPRWVSSQDLMDYGLDISGVLKVIDASFHPGYGESSKKVSFRLSADLLLNRPTLKN